MRTKKKYIFPKEKEYVKKVRFRRRVIENLFPINPFALVNLSSPVSLLPTRRRSNRALARHGDGESCPAAGAASSPPSAAAPALSPRHRRRGRGVPARRAGDRPGREQLRGRAGRHRLPLRRLLRSVVRSLQAPCARGTRADLSAGPAGLQLAAGA